jgi:hypothetical protein
MIPTLEVRWFGVEPTPSDVRAWYAALEGEPVPQPSRIDYYLRMTDQSDNLGIKLREGHLEFKQRYQSLGETHFHKHVGGLVESWRKWRYPVSESTQVTDLITPVTDWIAVAKRRQLRRYRYEDRQVLPVALDEPLEQGCMVEFSTISAAGEQWWSLCLETFGPEESLHDNFYVIADYLFSSVPPPQLEPELSFGYPKWLASLSGV